MRVRRKIFKALTIGMLASYVYVLIEIASKPIVFIKLDPLERFVEFPLLIAIGIVCIIVNLKEFLKDDEH